MILQKGMFLSLHLYYSPRNDNVKVICEEYKILTNS